MRADQYVVRGMTRVATGCHRLIMLTLAVVVAALVSAATASADVSNPTGKTFTATAGQPFDGTVADFSSTYAELSNFSATIDWGDGTPTTTGRISSCASCPGHGYDVAGAHTYRSAGTFPVTVVIRSARDATTGTAAGSANVTDSSTPPPPPPPPPTDSAPPTQPGAVVGTPGNDVLRGTAGKNSIYGLGGHDLIIGAGGNDILIAGPGNDKMKAGPGRDQIIAGHGRDTGLGGAGNDKLYDMDDLRDRFNGGGGRDVVFASTEKGAQGAKKVEAVEFVRDMPIVSDAIYCLGSFGCGAQWLGLYPTDLSGTKKLYQPVGQPGDPNPWDPAWSPNGLTIAFGEGGQSDVGGQIRTINWDGTGLKELTGSGQSLDSAPAWSPDGTKIAFVSDWQIWVMGKDGSGAVQLTDSVDSNVTPAWTPDGTRIWFSRLGELWSMNPDGSDETQITDGAGDNSSPAFSPDGKLLAWTRSGDPPKVMLALIGGFPLPAVLVDGFDPAFSPSGGQVAFAAGGTIRRINVGGSGLIEYDDHPDVYRSNPSWRW